MSTWRGASLLSVLAAAVMAPACGADAPASRSSADAREDPAAEPADASPDGPDGLADAAGPPDAPDAAPDADAAADPILEPDTAVPDLGADPAEEPLPPGEGVIVEIVPLDIWGQLLPDGLLLWTAPGAHPVALTDRPVASVRLTAPGRYAVSLSAPDHYDLSLALDWDGRRDPATVALDRSALTGLEGLSVARQSRAMGGVSESVVTLYLGLRHRWFAASGPPARRGNHVELLMDGEQAWQRVYDRLQTATDTVHVATWWWESNFELVRPAATHMTLTDDERRQNTILSLLDAFPGTARVLVWQDNVLDWLTVDDDLLARAATPDDGFEMMGMTNSTEGAFRWEIAPFRFGDRVRDAWPDLVRGTFDDEAPIASTVPPRDVDLTDWPLGLSFDVQTASWHQKFMVIDGREALIGGMNLKATDWDTSAHLVYDYRRMDFEATTRARQDVAAGDAEPDYGPRKDYMIDLVGPSVQDAEDVFQRRWDHQIATGRQYADNATEFTVRRDQPAFADGVPVQITTTMPDPFWEASILESQLNAIGNAEHYIYIEDQYWRAPLLTDALIARMEAVPDLVLIVVTKPISEWTDPGCEWTYITNQTLRERFPDRYFLFQLRSFDTQVTWGIDETESRFTDIDVHSKLLIVDGRFVSLGSCNKNDRGLLYEGELNAAILDDAFATQSQRRILTNMLGYDPDTDDPWEMAAALQGEADYNDAVYARWDDEGFDISLDGDPLPDKYQPFGFVYSLDFGPPDDCFIEGVGPDMMK